MKEKEKVKVNIEPIKNELKLVVTNEYELQAKTAVGQFEKNIQEVIKNREGILERNWNDLQTLENINPQLNSDLKSFERQRETIKNNLSTPIKRFVSENVEEPTLEALKAFKKFNDRVLNQILKLKQEAQAKQKTIQAFQTKVSAKAKYFVDYASNPDIAHKLLLQISQKQAPSEIDLSLYLKDFEFDEQELGRDVISWAKETIMSGIVKYIEIAKTRLQSIALQAAIEKEKALPQNQKVEAVAEIKEQSNEAIETSINEVDNKIASLVCKEIVIEKVVDLQHADLQFIFPTIWHLVKDLSFTKADMTAFNKIANAAFSKYLNDEGINPRLCTAQQYNSVCESFEANYLLTLIDKK